MKPIKLFLFYSILVINACNKKEAEPLEPTSFKSITLLPSAPPSKLWVGESPEVTFTIDGIDANGKIFKNITKNVIIYANNVILPNKFFKVEKEGVYSFSAKVGEVSASIFGSYNILDPAKYLKKIEVQSDYFSKYAINNYLIGATPSFTFKGLDQDGQTIPIGKGLKLR